MTTSKKDPGFVLGQIRRDACSGVEGTICARTEQFNGNVRYAVQPMKKKDELSMPEAYDIDQHLLDYIGPGISDRVTTPAVTSINLGDEVEHVITGFKGTAVTRTTYLNGCVHFVVQRKHNPAELIGGNPEGTYIECHFLKVTKAAKPVVVETEKSKKWPFGGTPDVSTRAPGGPATKAYRG